jgi:hypothetical protein
MNQELYAKLIDEICEISKATPSAERHERCDLAVDGTIFTLMPSRDRSGVLASVAYLADIGPLPEENKAEAAIELLETNLFFFGPDSPSFCCNPETGHVLLVGRMPLEALTAESALQFLSTVADLAFDWRGPNQVPEQALQPGVLHAGPEASPPRA